MTQRSAPMPPPRSFLRAARRGGLPLFLLFFAAAAALILRSSYPRAAEAGRESPYPHGEFQGDCALCHRADAWSPARPSREFRHAEFPLEGAHRTASCRSCHASLDFQKAGPDCADCHKDVHLAEFGQDCGRCHTTRSFVDRRAWLDAHRATRFPLTGAHVTQDCESCHARQPQGKPVFVGTPVLCVSCHRSLYDATTDPGHAASGFPLECERCHTTIVWDRARFDHADTRFPLTGAHRPLPCTACHANGVYRGTPTDCAACHLDDYNGTTDPNHVAVGFPTDCRLCHNTTSFDDARFADHDQLYFPITSGAHRGRWSSCSECHTNPANFTVFSCFLCHDQADTDDEHNEVNGYLYDSNACYQCHPRGRGDD